MNKADDIAPGEAVPHDRHRTLANRRPDPPENGFKPMRCSSIAHSSTVAWGNAVATALTSGQPFFKGVLFLGIGQGVARRGTCRLYLSVTK